MHTGSAWLLNICLVLGTVTTLWQTSTFVRLTRAIETGSGGKDSGVQKASEVAWHIWVEDQNMYRMQAILSLLYSAHVLSRLSFLGWQSFWRYHKQALVNRFDLISVSLLASAEVAVATAKPLAGNAIRLLAMARALRAVRLLWLVPRIHEMVIVLFDLILIFGRGIEIIFVVFYLYAEVGVELFGGSINTEASQFNGTDFGTSTGGYWAINMNDLLSAMVTLFALMIGNNFQVITQGLILALIEPSDNRPNMIVDASGLVASTFAVSFYVVINFGALNLLCALIIDAFSMVRKEGHTRVEGGRGLALSKNAIMEKVVKDLGRDAQMSARFAFKTDSVFSNPSHVRLGPGEVK